MNFLAHTSPEPEICTCCSRPAIPVAAIPNFGALDGFFVCAFCSLTLAFKVITMKPNQLHDIEHGAIEAAVKETRGDILSALFNEMWAHEVKDLTQMKADDFNAMLTALSESKQFNDAIKKCFLAYTRAVRLELTNLRG
jgi:hypothetical protein